MAFSVKVSRNLRMNWAISQACGYFLLKRDWAPGHRILMPVFASARAPINETALEIKIQGMSIPLTWMPRIMSGRSWVSLQVGLRKPLNSWLRVGNLRCLETAQRRVEDHNEEGRVEKFFGCKRSQRTCVNLRAGKHCNSWNTRLQLKKTIIESPFGSNKGIS